MGEAFRLHVATHLTCLRRNRLFHAFLALVVVGSVLAIVPAMAFDDDSNRFQTLRGFAQLLHSVTSLVTSGIGLFLLWVHRRSRSIKMVATTAAPFSAWVASLFATAAMVGGVAHVVGALLVYVLSWAWGVTYQYGFVYLALDRFVESLIALGLTTMLGAILHPVITVVFVMLVNEATVLAIRQGLEALSAGPVLTTVEAAATTLYYVLPSLDPFGERTRALLRTMRVAESDWYYLAVSAGYAGLMLAFAYVTTLSVMTRRPGT